MCLKIEKRQHVCKMEGWLHSSSFKYDAGWQFVSNAKLTEYERKSKRFKASEDILQELNLNDFNCRGTKT